MSAHHPVENPQNQDPFLYTNLVLSSVVVGCVYWIDLIDPRARIRLTEVDTGRYLIVGEPAMVDPLTFADEDLHIIIRGRSLRTETITGRDGSIYAPYDMRLEELAEYAFARKPVPQGMYITDLEGLKLNYCSLDWETVTDIRRLQHMLVHQAHIDLAESRMLKHEAMKA